MKRKHIYRLIFCFVMAFAFWQSCGKDLFPFFLPDHDRPEFYEKKASPLLPLCPLRVKNWGLGFQEKGTRPTGNASIEELKKYNAWYADDTDEKKYISLSTQAMIMETHLPFWMPYINITYMPHFFVVGTLIREKPELIREIVDAGHTVGNHTMTHPDMSGISTKEAFQKQLEDVEALYKEATGKEMTKFYRPPQGIYSTENLQMAKDLGYHTFFWSLAYVDWYQDKQPSKEEAFEKLLGRIHPGAIVLLHSTSSTNASILDELLTKWEEMGYTFGTLEELVEAA